MRKSAAIREARDLAFAAAPERTQRLRSALRRREFRRIARAWDDWYSAFSADRPDADYESARRDDAARVTRHLPRGAVLADIACGEGRLSRALASRCRRYEGFEASRVAVGLARARLLGFPNSSVHLLTDWTLPRPAAAYDAVVLYGVLAVLEVEASLALLREAARVLRPGGALFLDAPNLFDPFNVGRLLSPGENGWPDERRPRYWSRAMLRTLLPPLGLTPESIAPGRHLFLRARRR